MSCRRARRGRHEVVWACVKMMGDDEVLGDDDAGRGEGKK